MAIETGLEVLLRERPETIRGKHVGLLTNYACVTAELEYSIDLILGSGCRHVTVFAPEHGFWSDVQYMDEINRERWREGAAVTVIKSYDGANPTLFSPDPKAMAQLDVLIVEVQDVGARCYTYITTMVKAMGVAAELGVPVIVADRPNPIDGIHIEGNVNYHEPYISYVMHSPVPMRHAMTAAELARFTNDVLGLGCELDVVPMRGWHRAMHWNETGLPWISPSPNIATYESSLVYPGTVFLEGTNLSEGRGTTHPFELVGAPWLDSFELADRLNDLRLPGVKFRPQPFTPMFSKHSKQAHAHESQDAAAQCGGVFIHVTDANAFRPVRMGLMLIKVARDLAPERFAWRRTNYEFAHCMAIDALVATSKYQVLVDNEDLGAVADWLQTWEADEAKFAETRKPYLIAAYDEERANVVRLAEA
ncbi:MAG TPA: DUF1343 domain-containing protein [Thermoanaerobaculia bacterium]|jgi:uncharacterized protein YbbC (DUF1343 family)